TETPTIVPTTETPTTIVPTTQTPTTIVPTTETPTTIVPTTCPPVEIVVVPSELAPNPETIETVSITSGSCSSYEGNEFILRGLPALKSIVIGDKCFGKVRVFELDRLSELESVVIGGNSFRIDIYIRMDGSYRIVNCPKLKSIQIGDYSFSDYHSFELNNLPSLQSIYVGARCFSYAPSFSLTDLPQLQSVKLVDYAFACIHSIVFENLPKLQSIQLGAWALQGDISEDRKNTLTMRNLPSLTQFKGDYWNFGYIGSVILENIPQLSSNGIYFGSNCFYRTYSLQSSNATALESYIRDKSNYVN
ncbi:hypothetical protein WA588_003214, partial [Blastocystis sp. NMH]